MDPTRDNPFIRFAAFWWAIGSMLLFLALLLGIYLLVRPTETNYEEIAAKLRYETLAKTKEAQRSVISEDAFAKALAQVSAELPQSKPTAIETPAQVVAGSATAEKLAGGAGADLGNFDEVGDPAAPIDPAVMEAGQAAYLICSACHGQNGEGGPAGPPLAESEWVNGPISNLIRIQLRGLTGPITVKGTEHNLLMAPLSFQSDEAIAAVLTYIRNSFGNKGSAVTAEQVNSLRAEEGKPMLTVEDLIQP